MNTACKHLSKDPIMKSLIDIHGEIDLGSEKRDIFDDLIKAIINQQLSDKAADTIYSRFTGLLENNNSLNASEIVKLPDDTIRHKAGISYSKIAYIKNICEVKLNSNINFEDIHHQSDRDVFDQLTSIKGIGPWTAEMILMNTLKRPDIFSIGDAALKRAITNLYKIESSDHDAMTALSKTWSPFRSYASRYLWKSLG